MSFKTLRTCHNSSNCNSTIVLFTVKWFYYPAFSGTVIYHVGNHEYAWSTNNKNAKF